MKTSNKKNDYQTLYYLSIGKKPEDPRPFSDPAAGDRAQKRSLFFQDGID